MKQVGIIRGIVLRKLKELRVLITCLPDTEHDAIAALSGTEGVKTAERITNYVLKELGHQPPEIKPEGTGHTARAARKVM